MMRKLASTMFLALLVMVLVGCSAHTHIVGTGPTGSNPAVLRQWYLLWGLAPINNVDSHAMAGGATNYSIKTEANAVDVLISIVGNWVSLTSRTVTVTK